MGRVLKKYDRKSFYLATKLPLWKVIPYLQPESEYPYNYTESGKNPNSDTSVFPQIQDKNHEKKKKTFEEQRERLQVDHVDFYLLHALNKAHWKKSVDLGTHMKLYCPLFFSL